jgi:egghead protein (zeste-white 4 protein)
VTTHVDAPLRDEPDRTQVISLPLPTETHVLPAVRMPITPRATTMAQRHASWLPRMWPLALAFTVVLGVTSLFSVKSTGPLGPVVTIIWTYPVIGTVIGLAGAVITRRRLRRDRLTAADDQIIQCPFPPLPLITGFVGTPNGETVSLPQGLPLPLIQNFD